MFDPVLKGETARAVRAEKDNHKAIRESRDLLLTGFDGDANR